MASSSFSSLKKTIQPWLVQLGQYYFAEYYPDPDQNEALISTFVGEALHSLEDWLQRHPETSKRHWQNFTLAAALTAFNLLDVEVDLRELWHRCRDKCDRKEVERIKADMLLHQPEKTSVVLPPKPVASETKEPESAPVKAEDHSKDTSTSESDSESDDLDEDATLDEVADDDPQLHVFRNNHRREAFKPAYITYVHEQCFAQTWPFSTGADVTFPVLECVGRVFRTYVLSLYPAKTKEEVHNAAGGSLLAVLDYLQKLPKKASEAQLVCALYDELGLSSKAGILQVWQNLRAQPDLLADKCAVLRATTTTAPPSNAQQPVQSA